MLVDEGVEWGSSSLAMIWGGREIILRKLMWCNIPLMVGHLVKVGPGEPLCAMHELSRV